MNKKKIVRRARHGKSVDQVAALPYRFSEEGEVEVLLLTSRGTGRFVVPKGWPMKGRRDCDAAAREAWEEAGVKGFFGRSPIGAFSYQKQIGDWFVPVNVSVYPLHVEEELDTWKECDERVRTWVKPHRDSICSLMSLSWLRSSTR